MKKMIPVAFLLLVTAMSSCYNDKYDKLYPAPAIKPVCDTTAVSFKTDLVPIINTYCALASGCHSSSDHASSGLDFSTYAGFQVTATQDELINDINFTPSARYHSMPLNLPKMPACEISKMTAWVNQGARNN